MSCSPALLERECRMLSRHLMGEDPSDYVVRSYIEVHVAPALAAPARGIDRVLLHVARGSRVGSSLADAYAGLFVRTGLTRSKLVMLYSIFESTAPYHTTLDRVPRGGYLRLAVLGVWAGIVAFASTVMFGPFHLFMGRGGTQDYGAQDDSMRDENAHA